MAEITPVNPMPPTVPAQEPVIHTIPDQFYGIAGKAKLAPVAPPPKQTPTPQVPGTPGVPGTSAAPGTQTITQPPQTSKTWLLIPVAAIVILGALGTVAYFVLRKPASKAPTAPKPSITLPPAAKPEEKPPEPEPTAPEPRPEATTTPETPPAPEEAATATEPTPPPAPEPPPPAAAADADDDKVSDLEEGLYGTDPKKTDSDEDGFTDSVELINLYNPAGFKPTKLIDAGLVERYRSAEGKFELLYPSKWGKVDQPGGEVRFDNPENQPIAVSIEENPERQPVLDWYLSRNASVAPLDVKPFTTKQGYEAVMSPDGFTAYLSVNGKIFIVAYAPGLQENAHFRSTLMMMVNSLTRLP